MENGICSLREIEKLCRNDIRYMYLLVLPKITWICSIHTLTGQKLRQKQYEELHEYPERLKSYAYHIETCGEERNSYSKTDHDATFMRLKRDYMGNDQLLPAYNLQAAICDEYIAVIDVKPYASDMPEASFGLLLHSFRFQKIKKFVFLKTISCIYY